MFLFEGEFGNILHTGDCRLTPECLQNLPEKYIARKGKEPSSQLDFVFLDCTFGKSLMDIPSKQSALQQVFMSNYFPSIAYSLKQAGSMFFPFLGLGVVVAVWGCSEPIYVCACSVCLDEFEVFFPFICFQI